MRRARQSAVGLILIGWPLVAYAVNSEDYAIYSVVLDYSSIGHGASPQFAILRDTLDPRSVEAQAQPCARLRAFQLPARTASPERLEQRKLSILRPYLVITKEQADEWLRRRSVQIPTDPPGPESPDPYPGSTDLIRLSGILYNADRSMAAVYVSDTCGTLCGTFGWFVLEKSQAGGWRLLPNPGCESIA